MSIYRIMTFFNTGSTTKSAAEANRLVKEVLSSPDFRLSELSSFNAHQKNERLDKAIADVNSSPYFRQFSSVSITIDVPSGHKNTPPHPFIVLGLLYRQITTVIRTAFQSPLAHHYHLVPFKLFCHSPLTQKDERVMGELYTSDSFLHEHDKIQIQSPVPPDDMNCKREKVIAAIMFLSDATHLTNFGTARAWPIYLMLGNLSKYLRCIPNSGAMDHLAYIPTLPDSFQDFALKVHDKWSTQKKNILTHCRRELMHAVWKFLLDEDFLHAYTYGMAIKCVDGVERRIYPRIITYSADYPEKVLLATIRDRGRCPCPRCLVPKVLLDRVGLARDSATRIKIRQIVPSLVLAARRYIYNLGHSITGVRVEELLQEISAVPTINAFFQGLNTETTPFCVSSILVVDLLHEFELGVWKMLFKHLIRLLYAEDPRGDLVAEINSRYRNIPTFGRETIRKFGTNASEMKKLAARDFEDLLQCAIPVFEDILPHDHNQKVLKLLYRTAEWHALAKARMHTDSSVALLETLTIEFGRLARDFRDTTCEAYNTQELPGETVARLRRKAFAGSATLAPSSGSATVDDSPPTPSGVPPTPTIVSRPSHSSPTHPITTILPALGTENQPKALPRRKKFNIHTYKFHALGDYVRFIKLFGTTDLYSTQLGELAHRLVKMLYGRTNKKDALKQVAKQVNRRTALQDSVEVLRVMEKEELRGAAPELHHVVSNSRRNPINLFTFVGKHEGGTDPAKKGFIRKLQDHLLGQLISRGFNGDAHKDFTDNDQNDIHIVGNTVYSVQLLRVNYTTYDIRRDYDTINP
ncbi:hypothetical protein BDZ94DRAFT_826153 [Collybia nuda]|uniref:Uncharacterized protein n=1 Tax=Collybia nuda TaxID=64659 RepID=A0A9P5Y1W9_9AGAR|nr:hypothetical protein BDZ94DRAFT_826153 [Collybia nuda]